MTSIAGIFNNQSDAKSALSELLNAGFNKNNISLIVPDEDRDAMLSAQAGTGVTIIKGGVIGELLGASLGALVAGLIAVGSIMVKGVGLLVSGRIVAIISGAAIGAAAGGFCGILISVAFTAYEAKRRKNDVNTGKAVVIVHTADNDSSKRARRALTNNYATLKVEGYSASSFYM